MTVSETARSVLDALRDDGFAHLSEVSSEGLGFLLESLGEVIQTTDVKVNHRSRALVTSAKGLDFHTDHHKADIIAWHCIKQSSEGGESMLVDCEEILGNFTKDEKNQLAKINLYEHQIFDDDPQSYPLVSQFEHKYRCYYSFWLVDKNMGAAEALMLERFQRAIRDAEPKRMRLRNRDLLLVDNGRMLHGRTEIKGDKDRHLKRFWICNPDFFLPTQATNAGENHANISCGRITSTQ